MNKTSVGKLDTRLQILREYQVDDGHNGKQSQFREVCQAWSHTFIGSGTENYKFGRVFAQDSYVFVIRSRADIEIKPNDIAVYNGSRMNIRHINKIDERELYIAIEAEKGVGI
jgi:head-tail adaptor